ncbi:MAG: hypothetical protein HY834_13875 [Devosia nanyangense]|uniref:Uncharacterized protein n=1 Tax=Devosia nanyangense TaxID=1228055 RepID=A0A933L4F5_9HYPH|nr:hypothetical protein [Devosia nanyangense]
MANFIHIAEIAALLFASYVAGWGIGYFARRLTARQPAAAAAISAERLAVAMHETGDALVKAPVIEPVTTTPPPATPERPATAPSAVDETATLPIALAAVQPEVGKAPESEAAIAPTAMAQPAPESLAMVADATSEPPVAPDPPAMPAEAAASVAAEPAESVLADVTVAPFPTIAPLAVPIAEPQTEAALPIVPTDVFPEPVIAAEPPPVEAAATEPAVSAEQRAEAPFVEDYALRVLATPARRPGEAWSGEIKGRTTPVHDAPEPVLQPAAEPAVRPAASAPIAPPSPSAVAVPDEDAAMRAIEGGWSRRAARALPDKPELMDVEAAVTAAQIAVEQALAKIDAAVPPRKREGER